MTTAAPPLTKFHLKNLDCAACAAKLEDGLKKTAGVEDAAVDFVNQILLVRADDPETVRQAAHAIDPDVELVDPDASAPTTAPADGAAGLNRKKEGFLLTAAGVLFIWILVYGDRLGHTGPLSWELLVVLAAYLMAGGNVLSGAWRTVKRGDFFDENVLMVIATGGAIAIQAYAEAVGVMIFFKVGELLQDRAVSHSRRSIRALLAAKPDQAHVKTLEGLRTVAPETVQVGDTIVVKPGQKIPLDGQVLEGRSQIDTAALTGESVPVSVRTGDAVMAGQICLNGALTVAVTRPFRESSIARIMNLVENASARKARTEKFVTTFARYYTPAVVLIAAAVAFLPPLLMGDAFRDWIYRALVLLVISCPCALVISIPLGYFGGIGKASRKGILVKGSTYIDVLAAVKTVVFDKTGTLTRGVFEVADVVSGNGFSEEALLEFAAAAETHSDHPIAAAIVTAFEKRGGRLDSFPNRQDIAILPDRAWRPAIRTGIFWWATIISCTANPWPTTAAPSTIRWPISSWTDATPASSPSAIKSGRMPVKPCRPCATRASRISPCSPATTPAPPGPWPTRCRWTASRPTSCRKTRWPPWNTSRNPTPMARSPLWATASTTRRSSPGPTWAWPWAP